MPCLLIATESSGVPGSGKRVPAPPASVSTLRRAVGHISVGEPMDRAYGCRVMNATFDRNPETTPRLPFARRDRIEGLAYIALGLATLVAVCQFETVIARFIPRAPAFAAQLKSAPGVLVNGSYALGRVKTNHAAQAATMPNSGTNDLTRSAAPGRRVS